jgi:demethylspheroidene O-methyltransferase
MGDAYFGLYLLAMGSGRARTPRRLRELIEAAGFDEVALRRTALPLQTRVITARPAR